jgi:RNA polymerase sigma factor (sigma-70 family)
MESAYGQRDAVVCRLMPSAARAYQLAYRVTGSHEAAEDAVQQAFLSAMKELPHGLSPDEECLWFLGVATNAARMQMRADRRRGKREVRAMEEQPVRHAAVGAGQTPAGELVACLRQALQGLDEDYRLPVALCCEQGLSHGEAAAVLGVPRRTVSRHVAKGLELLRAALAAAGYTAAPAAVLGALAHTAPAVPATLAAAVGKIVSGQTTTVGSGSGAAASAAAKGGIAMKAVLGVVLAGTVAVGAAGLSAFGFRLSEPRETGSAPAAAVLATGENPVGGRQEREEVFEFAQKPAVTKQGDKVVIAFASKGRCDATVTIVDKDGKAVRRLASGVLGANAPWPFQQNSLSQKLEWDGRDDRGRPAPAGCRVKVSLGLKAALDRFFREEPRLVGSVTPLSINLVCDAQGNLYVADGIMAKVFDRDGNYQRQIWPPPASMPADKLAGIRFTKRVDGRTFPNLASGVGSIHAVKIDGASTVCGDDRIVGSRQTPVITPDGKQLIMVNSADRSPRILTRLGTDGSLAADNACVLHTSRTSEAGIGGVVGNNALHMAASPDGEWIYFGSSLSGGAHVVYRRKLADLKGRYLPHERSGANFVAPEVFLGEPGKAGNDERHFNQPRGVACDAAGNLYVSDFGNNRIQVFAPDGKFLRTIAAEGPDMLAVHPKTGALYVYHGGRNAVVKLTKDGKTEWTLPMKAFLHNDSHRPVVFCLDSSAEEPVVWVCDQDGLAKYVDRGGKAEKVMNVGEAVTAAWKDWLPIGQTGKYYLIVDRDREELYLRGGNECYPDNVMRIDGRTGKPIETMKAQFDDIQVGPDGLIYCRMETAGARLIRFNPADGKCVPFAKGVDYTFMGQKTTAIPSPGKGSSRTFQWGFTVATNGDIYQYTSEVDKSYLAEVQKTGHLDNSEGNLFLQVFGPDGSLKHASALPGGDFIPGGIRVTRNGNVYTSMGCRLDGQPPDGIVPGAPTWGQYGTLFRFDSAFDKYPVGRRLDPAPGEKPKYVGGKHNSKSVEPIRWDYSGMSPVNSLTGCRCFLSRFDLDGYERAWVPAAHSYSVNVLDANGNVISRIGTYGNLDSRGKNSPVADPKTGQLRPRRADDPADLKPPKELAEQIGFLMPRFVAASDEALYVVDCGNQRIVRCALGYHAEETVPAP